MIFVSGAPMNASTNFVVCGKEKLHERPPTTIIKPEMQLVFNRLSIIAIKFT
jgi:hypothetical protein